VIAARVIVIYRNPRAVAELASAYSALVTLLLEHALEIFPVQVVVFEHPHVRRRSQDTRQTLDDSLTKPGGRTRQNT